MIYSRQQTSDDTPPVTIAPFVDHHTIVAGLRHRTPARFEW